MLDALADLMAVRALERARQHDHRLDRERVDARRTGELVGGGEHGPTTRELDCHRASKPHRVAREVAARLGIDAADAAILERRLRAAVPSIEMVAPRAWHVALRMSERSDWKAGRYVLREDGWARLASTAVRAAHVMLAGTAAPVAVPDGGWLAAWRVVLADHELGIVIAAADHLDGGQRMGFVHGEPSRHVREHPVVAAALDRHLRDDDDDKHARIAVERWRRLRDAGWRDLGRTPMRSRGMSAG